MLSSRGKRHLLDGRLDVTTLLEKVEVSAASSTIIYAHLQVLEKLRQTKVELAEKIVVASEPLAEQIRLLMSIRGITALSAAAFLADVGDVRRFKSQRKMSAYLGMVPRARDSGGVSRPGHINRIYQVTRSSLQLQHQYAELIERRGVGRARIAMIRRLAGIMRKHSGRIIESRTSERGRFAAASTANCIGGARVEPVLEQLHRWLQQKHGQVLPGSALGKAVAFALGQWPKLIRYLEHAQLTPDNNACKQAIRPFVVGCKNWLFSGSPRGAAASATLYSLIETAKANGLEPYWYLRELFEKLPHARTSADYLSLLPTARPALPPSPPS